MIIDDVDDIEPIPIDIVSNTAITKCPKKSSSESSSTEEAGIP